MSGRWTGSDVGTISYGHERARDRCGAPGACRAPPVRSIGALRGAIGYRGVETTTRDATRRNHPPILWHAVFGRCGPSRQAAGPSGAGFGAFDLHISAVGRPTA